MFKNEKHICEFENCIDFFGDTNVKNLVSRVENLLPCVVHRAKQEGNGEVLLTYLKQFDITDFNIPHTITHKGLYKLFKQFTEYTN